MQKGQRVEGLLIENGKVQGGPGKIALLLPLSRDQNRGGGEGGVGGQGRRSWGLAAAGRRGERGRAAPGTDSPPQFRRRGPAGRGVTALAMEGGRAAMGSASRGGQGRVRAGKREREGPSTYLGPWLEQGGGGAGRPREAGVAGRGTCGGNVARPEKG